MGRGLLEDISGNHGKEKENKENTFGKQKLLQILVGRKGWRVGRDGRLTRWRTDKNGRLKSWKVLIIEKLEGKYRKLNKKVVRKVWGVKNQEG